MHAVLSQLWRSRMPLFLQVLRRNKPADREAELTTASRIMSSMRRCILEVLCDLNSCACPTSSLHYLQQPSTTPAPPAVPWPTLACRSQPRVPSAPQAAEYFRSLAIWRSLSDFCTLVLVAWVCLCELVHPRSCVSMRTWARAWCSMVFAVVMV